MAFIQKTTPPPNKVMNFSLRDFSGGMNNRSDQIRDNEGAVVLNLKFADETVLETRYGQKYLDDKVYEGNIIFIDEFKPYRGENQLVIATDTKLYIGDKSIALVGKPCGVNHMGKYYFTDGKKLRVYGKYHLSTEDVDENNDDKKDEDKEAVGSVNSTYEKYIGTPIEGYEFYEITSPAKDHAKLDTSHTKGVRTVNYTDKKVYYEPCTNEINDNFKGVNLLPTMVKYIVSHDNRLFVSGDEKDDDNIFITDLQNPLYYPVSLPIQVPPTSDKITGMHVFDNSVVVGREKDIYVISGSTNRTDIGAEPFKLKRLNTHTGFASHNSVDIAHNYLIFLGSDGNVYAIQNTKTYERDLATAILSRTIDLNKYPININSDKYKDAVSCFVNDEWHLSIGDKVLVYSYRHMSWVMYDSLNANYFYNLNGQLIWSNNTNRLITWDKNTFLDFGKPYQSLWYSKSFDMDEPTSFKQFREFFVIAHTFEEQFSDIYVTFEIDYANVKDRVVISNQLSRWGISKWGDRFINKNINESVPFTIGRRGRNIRFKVTNSYPLDGEVEVYGDLENYPSKKDNMLVKVKTDDKYFLYFNREWNEIPYEELNQRMKIYQINGDYEMRGKR